MPKRKIEPAHGHCEVCGGQIPSGVCWTLSGCMRRIHADTDDCFATLHPAAHARFLRLNPNYVSKDRYQVPQRFGKDRQPR